MHQIFPMHQIFQPGTQHYPSQNIVNPHHHDIVRSRPKSIPCLINVIVHTKLFTNSLLHPFLPQSLLLLLRTSLPPSLSLLLSLPVSLSLSLSLSLSFSPLSTLYSPPPLSLNYYYYYYYYYYSLSLPLLYLFIYLFVCLFSVSNPPHHHPSPFKTPLSFSTPLSTHTCIHSYAMVSITANHKLPSHPPLTIIGHLHSIFPAPNPTYCAFHSSINSCVCFCPFCLIAAMDWSTKELAKKTRPGRACRAWMGAHLPFGNTHQKGIYPFLGQTRYCAPDENSGCFRWTVTYSLNSHRALSLSPTCSVPLPLYANPFFSPLILCLHACLPNLLQSPLRFFSPSSLTARAYLVFYFSPLWFCITKYYVFSHYCTSLLPAISCYFQLYIISLANSLSRSLARRTFQPHLSHHPIHLFLPLYSHTPSLPFPPFLLPL